MRNVIDKQTTSGIPALAGAIGGFLGSTMGWLACGLAIAVADPIKGLIAKEAFRGHL